MDGLKKFFGYMLFALLGLFIQGPVLHSLFPSMVVPNLVLIIVVFVSFREASVFGAFIVFALGLLADSSSGVLLGPSAAAYVAMFGVFASLSQRFFVESPFASVVTVFLFSVLGRFLYLMLLYEFKDVGFHAVSVLFIEGLVTALCAPVVLPLLKKVLLGNEGSPTSRTRISVR